MISEWNLYELLQTMSLRSTYFFCLKFLLAIACTVR